MDTNLKLIIFFVACIIIIIVLSMPSTPVEGEVENKPPHNSPGGYEALRNTLEDLYQMET